MDKSIHLRVNLNTCAFKCKGLGKIIFDIIFMGNLRLNLKIIFYSQFNGGLYSIHKLMVFSLDDLITLLRFSLSLGGKSIWSGSMTNKNILKKKKNLLVVQLDPAAAPPHPPPLTCQFDVFATDLALILLG